MDHRFKLTRCTAVECISDYAALRTGWIKLWEKSAVFTDISCLLWNNSAVCYLPVTIFYYSGARNFLLCYCTGCQEAIHDEFLLAEPCKCVNVSDVLKYLAADKCNEW